MKLKSPIVTLIGGLILALILWALGANAAHKKASGYEPAAASPTPSATSLAPSPTAPASKAPVPAPDGTFAGHTQGGGASIAIAVKGGKAIAYLCSGKIESWLQGTAADGKITMTGSHSGVLDATYSGDTATGTVTVGSQRFGFQIKVVKPPSGLYRAAKQVTTAKIVAGWIVLADGTQIGMVDTNGTEKQAPPLDPASLSATVDGNTLTASPIDGGETL
jgi:serine/threonine-protein kinase